MSRAEKSFRLSTVVAAGVATGLAGCASNSRDQDLAYIERPVEQLYLTGTEAFERKRFEEAVQYFNEVERQHPYSEWASRAQVMTAYAHYQSRNFDEVIAAADRYLALHPGSDSAAYAYYLKAVSYFEQIMDVGRDQGITENAKVALTDVIRRFPDTDYARDSQLKLDMVNDQLAGKEMTVGRWYLRNDQHLAAINRFRTVVTEFSTTSHAPEALYRMVEAYLTLGLLKEAEETAAVLGYNDPTSVWYSDAYRLITGEGGSLDVAPSGERRRFLGIF